MDHPAYVSPPFQLDRASWAWLILLILALAVYAFGLGGQYNPSNGDELVYAHIARLTAASGHWLPLVSELDHMRNTKPPLLFWQALLAGGWGQNWTMAALRAPSLIYTLLVAGAVAWSAQLVTRNWRMACLAACVYLAFFSTFRYGRTFLTSAPETFWLNLPVFWLLWQRLRRTPVTGAGDLGWPAHIGFGLALGLGLAYKSFALIAPAAAALWCAQLLSSNGLSWRATLGITTRVSLSAAIALGIFALWFVFDPNPAAVWQEFVIGENAGKLSDSQGYWQVALFGGDGSIWAQLLAYAQNAGLLAFVVVGLGGIALQFGRQAWQKRGQRRADEAGAGLPAHLMILLVWLTVWIVVFSLPSQRSARYVIPAMPAVAMLIALYWERIARGWFLLSLLLCGVFIGVLGRIAWAAYDMGIGTGTEFGVTMLAMIAGLSVVIGGVFKRAWTRACTLAAAFAVYACFGLTTAPLNGESGQYPRAVSVKLQQARVAVPSGFNGQFERFQFLLPGNQFVPYAGEGHAASGTHAAELKRLISDFDAVVWLQADLSESAPPCAPDCTVIGTRWEVKGRHQPGEITLTNLWYPQTWLFRREWLIRR